MQWFWFLGVALLPLEAPAVEEGISVVAAWEDPRDAILAFQSWFSMVGGDAPGLEMFHTEETGYGVRTTKEIQEGDEIMWVPKDMVFSRATAIDTDSLRQRGLTTVQRDALARTTYDEDLLSLLLLRERARGETSFFAPWMKLLPKKAVSMPSVLHQDRMREMLDESAFHRAKPAGKRRSDRYHRIKEQIRAMTEGFPLEKEMATLEAFVWADSIVSARAITTQSQGKILAPFYDMLNYAPHPQARKRNHAKLFNMNHRLIGNVFMVMADRYTPSGQEVFEDYGKHDSEYYFHTAGFVPDGNPFDCVTVRLPMPSLRSKARPLVRMLGVPQNPEACLRPGRAIPDQMLYHLHMLSLPDDAAAACVERLTADPEAGALPCFDESYTVESAWNKMLEILADQLKTPKKKASLKERPEDIEDLNLMFLPSPSEVQPLFDTYDASRLRLLRALLKAPAPPEVDTEEEEEEADLVEDVAGGKGKRTGKLGLEDFISIHNRPLLDALRVASQKPAKKADKMSEALAAQCGIGVRKPDTQENRWAPAPKASAKEPVKEPEPEAKKWPEPVRVKLLELRKETGRLLAESTGNCGST